MLSNNAVVALHHLLLANAVQYGPAADDQMEMIKELAVRVLRECGLWSGTRVLGDVATAIIAAKTMVAQNTMHVDPRINYDSLAPGKHHRGLHYLATCPDNVRALINFEAKTAASLIETWLWEATIENDELDEALFDVSLVFSDVAHFCA